MDLTNEARQQKFREKMKSDGKRLRVFFLSDAAMDSIKILKEKTNAPGLNYALKSLLIGKTIEQDINNQAIIE